MLQLLCCCGLTWDSALCILSIECNWYGRRTTFKRLDCVELMELLMPWLINFKYSGIWSSCTWKTCDWSKLNHNTNCENIHNPDSKVHVLYPYQLTIRKQIPGTFLMATDLASVLPGSLFHVAWAVFTSVSSVFTTVARSWQSSSTNSCTFCSLALCPSIDAQLVRYLTGVWIAFCHLRMPACISCTWWLLFHDPRYDNHCNSHYKWIINCISSVM